MRRIFFSILTAFLSLLPFLSGEVKGDEGRGFVYTIINPEGPNEIAAYRRDPDTGQLIFIGVYPTGGRGTGRVIDSQSPIVASAQGTFLFAVNAASNDISVMSINEDGSLQLLGSPVPSGGISPSSLALSDDLLYVANKGDSQARPNYTGFRVSASGELTPINRSTVEMNTGDNPGQVLFNRSGTRLIGTRISGRMIDSFRVRQTGRKQGRLRRADQIEAQNRPFGATFNPAREDQLLVSNVNPSGAGSYRISDEGDLSAISLVNNSPERAACWIAVHINGRFAWVANTGTSSLSLYTINENGALTLAGTHNTAAYGRSPFEIAFDREGRFLYELNVAAGSQSIHVMRVTGESANGGLEDVAAFSLPSGGVPAGLAMVER